MAVTSFPPQRGCTDPLDPLEMRLPDAARIRELGKHAASCDLPAVAEAARKAAEALERSPALAR